MLIGPNFKRLRKQSKVERLQQINSELQKVVRNLTRQNKELTDRLRMMGINTNEGIEIAEGENVSVLPVDLPDDGSADETPFGGVPETEADGDEGKSVEGAV